MIAPPYAGIRINESGDECRVENNQLISTIEETSSNIKVEQAVYVIDVNSDNCTISNNTINLNSPNHGGIRLAGDRTNVGLNKLKTHNQITVTDGNIESFISNTQKHAFGIFGDFLNSGISELAGM